MDEIDRGYVKLAQATISKAIFDLDSGFFKFNPSSDDFLGLAFYGADANWATRERFYTLIEGLKIGDEKARAEVSRIGFLEHNVLEKFGLKGVKKNTRRGIEPKVVEVLRKYKGRKTAEELSLVLHLSPRWIKEICKTYKIDYRRITWNHYR